MVSQRGKRVRDSRLDQVHFNYLKSQSKPCNFRYVEFCLNQLSVGKMAFAIFITLLVFFKLFFMNSSLRSLEILFLAN